MLASFSFHDDGQVRRTGLSPPLSAVRHVHEVETGRAESPATVGTRSEGFFDLVERETSSSLSSPSPSEDSDRDGTAS